MTKFKQAYGLRNSISLYLSADLVMMCLCGMQISLYGVFGPPSIPADRQTGASGLNLVLHRPSLWLHSVWARWC